MISKHLTKWNEQQIRTVTAAAACLLSLILILVDVYSYRHYRKTLIRTEQGQLMTIARTIGTSLQQYMEQELETIDICFGSRGTGDSGREYSTEEAENTASGILSGSDGLYRACRGIRDGEVLFSLGKPSEELMKYAGGAASGDVGRPDADGAVRDSAAIIGKYIADTGWYEVVIGKAVNTAEGSISLLFAIDLNRVHQKIVSPVHIGHGGYSVVKDSNLAIIMHHAKSQIGMDALYDREKEYPQLDLRSLREWLEMQRAYEEGTSILDSYVWDDPELTPVRRIVAYTTIDITGERWIVNSTLPIREISAPLGRMLSLMALLTLLYLALVILITTAVTRALTSSVAQNREIAYLREINRGMELIAKKNEEIRHYQRVQSLGMMSSHIAHEFNNYLTPVMIYGEMLEGDTELPEDTRLMLREMMKSVEQAARLSRELLDFSRADTGGRFQALNLSSEVAEAADLLHQLVPRKIVFVSELSEEPAWMMGREGMMRHILMNLGKNAFHAMEESEKKELRICYRVSGNTAELTISDTGCGIPEENCREIFEPFYTTKGSRQGTGLGLSVVRSLVENTGGRIRLESTVGQGTSFILTFPVKPDAAELEPVCRAAADRGIVCVCRDPQSLERWNSWLTVLPEKPKVTTQVAAAVARLQDPDTDCHLLVIQEELSSMDGVELAQIVRRDHPELRIVILASQDSQELQRNLDNRVIDEVVLPDPE